MIKVGNEFWNEIPNAEIVEIQSIDTFNSFYPMEIIATREEFQDLLSEHPDLSYLLFPESREFPIRMTDDLPYRWIRNGTIAQFQGEACMNEYYAFQIGLFAARNSIDNINISFTELAVKSGKESIPAERLTCFNKTGINWDGQAFSKNIPVDKGKIQPLWFGVDIPDDISPGKYYGTITIQPDNLPEQSVEIELSIKKEFLKDRGDSDPWRHSRLRWLNSQLAVDHDYVEPFTPLVKEGNAISCLSRKIILNEFGLPHKVMTYFNPEVTGVKEESEEVVSQPIKIIVNGAKNETEKWDSTHFKFQDSYPGLVRWISKISSLRNKTG